MRLLRPTLLIATCLLAVIACGDDDPGTTDVVEDQVLEPEREPMYDPLEEPTAKRFSVDLQPLNDSGVEGFAVIDVDDEGMTVTVESLGFDDVLGHPQHLHARGEGRCPEPGAAGDDGVLTGEEADEAYGPPLISLTTEGDVGPDSQLDLDRFPMPIDGAIGYSRSFQIPAPVQLSDLTDAVLVQHGLPAHEGASDAYDGVTPSSMDTSVPLEATLPVACGALVPEEADER